MAMWRVEELLRKVTDALNGAKVPYAVVGGNAVAEWVSTVDEDAVRATKDVDVLTRRDCIPAMTQALAAIDLIPTEVMGVYMFVDKEDPSPKRGVHVVIANERIRPQYAHPAPDVTKAVRSKAGFMVIDLPSLVAMKLQAYRPIDQAHLIDMLSLNLISDDVADALPPDLKPRLDEVRRKSEEI